MRRVPEKSAPPMVYYVREDGTRLGHSLGTNYSFCFDTPVTLKRCIEEYKRIKAVFDQQKFLPPKYEPLAWYAACDAAKDEAYGFAVTQYFVDPDNLVEEDTWPRRDPEPRIVGKKEFSFNAETNTLQIWHDNELIYENANGRICRDMVALIDSE